VTDPNLELTEDDIVKLVAERDAALRACLIALRAIAPCVVGWRPGERPVWAEKLLDAVGPLREALGLPAEFDLGEPT
jgi:hypothetical protein